MSVVYEAPRAPSARALATHSAGRREPLVYPNTDSGAAAIVSSAVDSPDARHLARLEQAVTVCLSPLDYADGRLWGEAVGRAIAALAGASGGAIMLPTGVPEWQAFGTPLGDRSTGQPGTSYGEATELLGVGEADPPGDGVFWARDALDANEAIGLETAPTRLANAVGIRVRTVAGAVAGVYVWRDRASGAFPPCVIPALRAIAPAFQAGTNLWLSSAASRSTVERMMDSLSEGALLFDLDGTLVHTNPGVDQLAAQTSARVRDEAQRVAWALGAATSRRQAPISGRAISVGRSDAHVTRVLHVGALVYRLRGSVVGEQLVGSRAAVLVTVAAAASAPLTDGALQARYGLTPREVQVTRLIAQGLSNTEIAEQLGVRFFTARNHVERTLAKLGVASRHRVGPLLRNELGETGEGGRATAA